MTSYKRKRDSFFVYLKQMACTTVLSILGGWGTLANTAAEGATVNQCCLFTMLLLHSKGTTPVGLCPAKHSLRPMLQED